MPNDILSVVIDERKQLETLDSEDFLAKLSQYRHQQTTNQQRQVFKNYLMSSEVFYIDSELP